MNKKKILFLIFLIAATVVILIRHNAALGTYHANEGFIFGTTYRITYKSDKDLGAKIYEQLQKVDNSLSPFNKNSIITKVNNNLPVELDSMFIHVFERAQEVASATGGAFDITVAPIVNAWGFGYKQGIVPDSATVDSIMQYVGYKSIALNNGNIIKEHPKTELNCSAIAKGYGCDAVAELLEKEGATDYLVEIGGEVAAKGKNNKGGEWIIGIAKPEYSRTPTHNENNGLIHISGKSVATSGNYRNFREIDGKRYSHTIDPHTGYPTAHNLLSASVIADDCTAADAYATAFMSMGLEKALEYCKAHNDIDAFFIYADKDGSFQTAESDGFDKYRVKEK